MKHMLLVIALLCTQLLIQAQPGALDATFTSGGKKLVDFGGGDDKGGVILIQPDGKIIAAGGSYTSSWRFALARYNSNGTTDNTFNGNGKIVAGGGSYICRYLSTGALDNTFGSNGKLAVINTGIEDLALQTDGKIVSVGYYGKIVRYTTTGKVDSSFGTNGMVSLDTAVYDPSFNTQLAIQPDGKIIVGGERGTDSAEAVYVFRCTATGITDNSFGTNGWVNIPISAYSCDADDLTLQQDGKIVLAGLIQPTGSEGDVLVIRLNPDGTLDSTFGNAGISQRQFGRMEGADNVAMQPDGKIVVSGFGGFNTGVFSFMVARLKANGTADSTFGTNGCTFTQLSTFHFSPFSSAYGMALQSDGKIVLAGEAVELNSGMMDMAIARYLATGVTDITGVENEQPLLIYPNPGNNILNLAYAEGEIKELRIYNVNGATVIHDNSGSSNYNVSSLNPGLYIVEVAINGSVVRKRWLKL